MPGVISIYGYRGLADRRQNLPFARTKNFRLAFQVILFHATSDNLAVVSGLRLPEKSNIALPDAGHDHTVTGDPEGEVCADAGGRTREFTKPCRILYFIRLWRQSNDNMEWQAEIIAFQAERGHRRDIYT